MANSAHQPALPAAIRESHDASRAQGLPCATTLRVARIHTSKDYIMAVTRHAAPRADKREDKIDAIALLGADHKELKQLFKSYDALVDTEAGDEKEALAEQICSMLVVHATIEEEIFYPAARQSIDEQDLLDEAEVEHASAKDLIAQIQDMDPADDLFDAKVKVLGEYVAHHVKEEEEELFPKTKRSALDLQALGKELSVRKQQLMAEARSEQDA
jgi:hypothetical protein